MTLPGFRGGTGVVQNRRTRASVIASLTTIGVFVVALSGSAAERASTGAASPEALLARAHRRGRRRCDDDRVLPHPEVTSRVTALVAGFDRLRQRHGLPVWLKPG